MSWPRMPGCESLEKIGEDEYEMKMKMADGQHLRRFRREGADHRPDRRPTSFRLIVEGTGKIGFMKGEGLLTLTPKDAGTEVCYEGDVQVGGTIAASASA